MARLTLPDGAVIEFRPREARAIITALNLREGPPYWYTARVCKRIGLDAASALLGLSRLELARRCGVNARAKHG